MAIFSGRTAAQTGAPGSASTLPAVRRRPAGGAFDARTVVAEAAFEQIDVADEVGDPARIRLLIDFRRRRDLHEPAAIHDADAVGERHRFALVVRDDDEGEAEPALKLHQLELGFAAQLLVERRQRLVEQQHARPLDQRPRQRHALALAAGKLMRLAAAEIFELEHREHVGDARPISAWAGAPA